MTRCYGGESSFGGQHARFHRGVTALDARHIDEASRTADERTAREAEFRHCLPSALVNGTRAIGDAAFPLQDFTDFRMLFPTLEFLKRREPGISVAEADHEPERHLPDRTS